MRQGQHEVVALGPLSKRTPSFLLAHFLLLGSGLQALVRFGGLLVTGRLITGLWTFLGSVAVQSWEGRRGEGLEGRGSPSLPPPHPRSFSFLTSYSLWSPFPSCQT